MEKAVYLALAAFALTACKPKEDPEAAGQACLAEARACTDSGRYGEARAAIDSMRVNSPLAFNAREEGILLLDSIDLAEARKNLGKADSALALNPAGKDRDSILFDKEEAAQRIAFFTKKLAHDKANFKRH